MKFSAIQRYILTVYAISIIALTIFVPTYANNGSTGFGFVLYGYNNYINVGFLLIEYLAFTLALVAALLATKDMKR